MRKLAFGGEIVEFEDLLARAGIRAHRTSQSRFVQYKTDDGATINWYKESRSHTVYVDGDGLAAQAVAERLETELDVFGAESPRGLLKRIVEHLGFWGFVADRQERARVEMTASWFDGILRLEESGEDVIRIWWQQNVCTDEPERLKTSLAEKSDRWSPPVTVSVELGKLVSVATSYLGEYDQLRFANALVPLFNAVNNVKLLLKHWLVLPPEDDLGQEPRMAS